MTDLAFGANCGSRAAKGLSGSIFGGLRATFALACVAAAIAPNATAPKPAPVRSRKSRREKKLGDGLFSIIRSKRKRTRRRENAKEDAKKRQDVWFSPSRLASRLRGFAFS